MKGKLFLALSLALFASCIKDKVAPPSQHDLLTSHTWYVQSILFDGKSLSAPCLLGNYFIFATSGNGYFDIGPSKCNPLDSQRYNFSYSVASDFTTMDIQNAGKLISNLGDNSYGIDSPVNNISCSVKQINSIYLELTFVTKDTLGRKHNYDYLFVDN